MRNKKIFLLFFFMVFSFGFTIPEDRSHAYEHENRIPFHLLNEYVFFMGWSYDFQILGNQIFIKHKWNEEGWNSTWFLLEETNYFDMNSSKDPKRYLPRSVPEESVQGIDDLFEVLEIANDELWKDIVYLIQFGIKEEVIFFDVDDQNFYTKQVQAWEYKEKLDYLIEGIEARMFFIESNRFHFFLDSVLLFPEGFKSDWFDTIYAWEPPALPK